METHFDNLPTRPTNMITVIFGWIAAHENVTVVELNNAAYIYLMLSVPNYRYSVRLAMQKTHGFASIQPTIYNISSIQSEVQQTSQNGWI